MKQNRGKAACEAETLSNPIRLNSTVLQTPFDESQEDDTQAAKNVFLSNYIWDVCL